MHRWVPIWTLRPLHSVSKPYIFHCFECLLRRIKLRLSFDMLASLFRVELGRRADSACFRRCRFLVHRWAMIWLWGPFTRWVRHIFHNCECLLWRVKLGLSFDILASIFRAELDPMAASACHRRCRFRVHRWAMFLTLRPLHSVSTPNISRVRVSIKKGWARAFIWCTRLSIQSRFGSESWFRMPS